MTDLLKDPMLDMLFQSSQYKGNCQELLDEASDMEDIGNQFRSFYMSTMKEFDERTLADYQTRARYSNPNVVFYPNFLNKDEIDLTKEMSGITRNLKRVKMSQTEYLEKILLKMNNENSNQSTIVLTNKLSLPIGHEKIFVDLKEGKIRVEETIYNVNEAETVRESQARDTTFTIKIEEDFSSTPQQAIKTKLIELEAPIMTSPTCDLHAASSTEVTVNSASVSNFHEQTRQGSNVISEDEIRIDSDTHIVLEQDEMRPESESIATNREFEVESQRISQMPDQPLDLELDFKKIFDNKNPPTAVKETFPTFDDPHDPFGTPPFGLSMKKFNRLMNAKTLTSEDLERLEEKQQSQEILDFDLFAGEQYELSDISNESYELNRHRYHEEFEDIEEEEKSKMLMILDEAEKEDEETRFDSTINGDSTPVGKSTKGKSLMNTYYKQVLVNEKEHIKGISEYKLKRTFCNNKKIPFWATNMDQVAEISELQRKNLDGLKVFGKFNAENLDLVDIFQFSNKRLMRTRGSSANWKLEFSSPQSDATPFKLLKAPFGIKKFIKF